MNLTEELVQRCALKRRAAIGSMSDAAYEELLLAVQSDLKSYASETDELPMYHLVQAVKRHQDSQLNDDSYTDEEFVQARITRLQTFLHALENIREKYGECIRPRKPAPGTARNPKPGGKRGKTYSQS